MAIKKKVSRGADAPQQKPQKNQMSASEVRHDRFLRVASKRTRKALESLRLLGACSNRRVYLYSDKEVERVLEAVQEQMNLVRESFRPGRKRQKVDFDLQEE